VNLSPLSESQSQGNSQRTHRSRSAGGSSLQFTLSPGGSNSQQLSQESAPPAADSTRDERSAAPSYCKTQLTSMKVAALAQLCTQRGIALAGKGKNGRILKQDYVEAVLRVVGMARPPTAPSHSTGDELSGAAAPGQPPRKKTADEWNKARAAETKKEKEGYFDAWMEKMNSFKQEATQQGKNWSDLGVRQGFQEKFESHYHSTVTLPKLEKMRSADAPPCNASLDDDDAIDAVDAQMKDAEDQSEENLAPLKACRSSIR